MEPAFWHERWALGQIGFHQERVHPALPAHEDVFLGAEGLSVLVPLCGKSLDLLWLLEQDLRVTGKGARQGDALLFTARQLARLVRQALAQSDLVQQRLGLCACAAVAADLQWQGDILQRCHPRQELKGLKDKTDPAGAQRGPCILVQRAEIVTQQ